MLWETPSPHLDAKTPIAPPPSTCVEYPRRTPPDALTIHSRLLLRWYSWQRCHPEGAEGPVTAAAGSAFSLAGHRRLSWPSSLSSLKSDMEMAPWMFPRSSSSSCASPRAVCCGCTTLVSYRFPQKRPTWVLGSGRADPGARFGYFHQIFSYLHQNMGLNFDALSIWTWSLSSFSPFVGSQMMVCCYMT